MFQKLVAALSLDHKKKIGQMYKENVNNWIFKTRIGIESRKN